MTNKLWSPLLFLEFGRLGWRVRLFTLAIKISRGEFDMATTSNQGRGLAYHVILSPFRYLWQFHLDVIGQ